MGVRERVHRAIESATADADKTLSEIPHAGDHERLTILLEGWFRGLADALEELAIEVDLLHESRREDEAGPPPDTATVRLHDAKAPPDATGTDNDEDVPLDEAALAERARASREETEAVRARAGEPETGEPTEKEE